MLRIVATRTLLNRISDELIVSNLGRTTFDLHGSEDREANFYLFGAMGMASSLALGLALAVPDRRVIALEGDGALLMNLGSLATISRYRPENFVMIVWDNEQYESTGGQPTFTAHGLDLARVAASMGGIHVATATDLESLDAALDGALVDPGPHVIVAKVVGDGVKRPVPRTPVVFKERFQRHVAAARAEDEL